MSFTYTYSDSPSNTILISVIYSGSGSTVAIIESTVVTIGQGDVVFDGALTGVDFTTATLLVTIGHNAFNNCTALLDITIPSSVTSIGDYAFNLCSLLTSIPVSNNVTNIGQFAFSASGLTSFAWPTSTPSISFATFYLCTSLLGVTNINSVIIADSAFEGCSALTSFDWDNRQTNIDVSTFRECTSLSSIININTVTTISANAFQGCSGLISFTFPDTLTAISSNAFDGCSQLANIAFGSIVIANLDAGSFSSTTAINIGNYGSLTTMLNQGYLADNLNIAGFDSIAVAAAVAASCFNEDTQILLFKDGEEQYVTVQDLQAGDLVKTHLHGYKKVDLIGKSSLRNDINNKWTNRMYVMYKTEENGLTEDLIMTGGHSILVDKLSDDELSYYKNNKLFIIKGEPLKIDDKYLLLAGVSKQFKAIEDTDVYTYYNFCLENDGDVNKRFGVFANGILAETPSKAQFLKFKGYKLD